jgi:hypothetical protein
MTPFTIDPTRFTAVTDDDEVRDAVIDNAGWDDSITLAKVSPGRWACVVRRVGRSDGHGGHYVHEQTYRVDLNTAAALRQFIAAATKDEVQV